MRRCRESFSILDAISFPFRNRSWNIGFQNSKLFVENRIFRGLARDSLLSIITLMEPLKRFRHIYLSKFDFFLQIHYKLW